MRKTKLFGWLFGIALCACMLLWMPQAANAADEVTNDAEVTINGETTQYATLGEAFAAVEKCIAEDNAVVTVLKDLSDVRQTDISGVFTLDLNGCIVRGIRGWSVFQFVSSANVTITGGTIIPNWSYAVNNYGGSVTINDVTIVENNDSNGVSVSTGGQLTVNGATDISADFYAIHAYGADVTINGGKFRGYWCINAENSSNVTINGGVFSQGGYGSGGYHITMEDAASQAVVTTAGVVFKNNLRVSGITLNELLSDGLAYWQNGSMIVPADGATIVSANGDVTVQAACKHENVAPSYTDNGIDHTYVYACCGYTVTEAHNYGDDLICDGCGHDKNSIFIMLHSTYTSGWYGNAIKVYEDGVLIATVDLPYGVYHSAWVMPMDLDKEYEFYWVEGQRAYTCSFEIYVAGEKVLTSIPDCRDYFNGELLYSYKVCSGWTQIDGDWYYYDPETNEPVTGIVRVPYPTESINGYSYGPDVEDVAYYENKGQIFIDKDTAQFVFNENGVFQSDLNGLTSDNRWAVNGCIVWHVGLVEAGENYYYFIGDVDNGGNKMATGDTYVSRNTTDFDMVAGGVYTFGADGKLCKNEGIVDLRYYENYRLMLGNGLTKVGENYIYVNSNGELIVDSEYYVPGNDLGIASGTYIFDENGYLVEPVSTDKDGIYFENGAWYYYESGKTAYNKGLISVNTTWHSEDGAENVYSGYIYVRSSGKLATGAYYITNVSNDTSGLFTMGMKVLFDENGIADAPKNGIYEVDSNLYYFVGDQIQYNAGLIELGGGWIYVRSNGQLAVGDYWITNTNGNMEQGMYEFGEDGYLVITDIEDGIVNDNGVLYYYLDGKKQYGLGLVKLEDGSYIYVRTNGQLAVGSYWITNHKGLLPEGMYEFNQEGTLTVN
ncbi:MAG: hypothetical protein IJW14_04465 [Oscillospiraceae bacterium]|nr:hypothetical protein [Oscillospiraceae bacterium]